MPHRLKRADELRESEPQTALVLYEQANASISADDLERIAWISDHALDHAQPGIVDLCERVVRDSRNAASLHARHVLGSVAWYAGRGEDARAHWHAIIGALDRERPRLWVRACLNLAATFSARDQHFESLVLTGMGLRAAQYSELPFLEAFACTQRAETLVSVGDYEQAHDLAMRAESFLSRIDDPKRRAIIDTETLAVWGRLYAERHQWARALRVVQRRIDRLQSSDAARSVLGGAHVERLRLRFESDVDQRAEILTQYEALPEHFDLGDDWFDEWKSIHLKMRVRFAIENLGDRGRALDAAREQLEWIGDSRQSHATRVLGAANLARQLADELEAPAEARRAFDLAATASLRRIVQAHRRRDSFPELAHATPEDWIALGRYRQTLANRQRSLAARVAGHFRPEDPALGLIVDDDDMVRVCAWCSRVAARDRSWLPIEHFSPNESGFEVTHGICPACRDVHFPLRSDR